MADNILRQSQLITTYGPGAMIDLPDYSVIIAGLQDWSHLRREKVDEPRLTAKLRQMLNIPILDLWTPPRHEESPQKAAPVGARIFPTWFIVKEAHQSPQNPRWRRRRLVRWDQLDRGRFREVDGKRKPVVPVRFVCGCRRGHIDDLDWRRFLHPAGNVCHRPLWLEERGSGADIGDTFGVCDCGTARSLYEASVPDTGALGQCQGKRPWIGQYAREICGEPYRLLVRTASNAYFPQKMSVISLPEFDAGLASIVSAQRERLEVLAALGQLENFRKVPALRAAFDGISDEAVLVEFRRQQGEGEQEEVPVKIAEFEVLDSGNAVIGKDRPRARFHAETLARKDWDPGQASVLATLDKLVLVHRLREVTALLGFTRFEAHSADKDGELELDVARASLAETITWLPAIENQGEGIFLSVRSDEIQEWLARTSVAKRGRDIMAGWQAWAAERGSPPEGFPGLPYIMLHSLSHMLMTSIALECGYPASSLRERVYAGERGYGILIFTASSDSEGTLGGLVEAGRHLESHLRRALQDGGLCSNDPVCAEHVPSSPLEHRPLHGAACHGCLLIAETSCEQRNDFLDRALVVPTVSVRDAAFFDVAGYGP